MKRSIVALGGISVVVLASCIVTPREPQPVYTQPQPQTVAVSGGGGGYVCYESCRYSHDGECDDGRPGAHTSLCTYGSDCGDCGPGAAGGGAAVVVTPATSGGYCVNTCRYAFDGECDDGRPGSHTSLCAYGSDCGDCGAAY